MTTVAVYAEKLAIMGQTSNGQLMKLMKKLFVFLTVFAAGGALGGVFGINHQAQKSSLTQSGDTIKTLTPAIDGIATYINEFNEFTNVDQFNGISNSDEENVLCKLYAVGKSLSDQGRAIAEGMKSKAQSPADPSILQLQYFADLKLSGAEQTQTIKNCL